MARTCPMSLMIPPRSSIPDDLAGHARQAERVFQGGAVPLPGRSGCFIGAHQKVHERLLGVVGGAHRVVGPARSPFKETRHRCCAMH